MNTARLLVPIFTLQDFLYLLLDFLLAGFLADYYAPTKATKIIYIMSIFFVIFSLILEYFFRHPYIIRIVARIV